MTYLGRRGGCLLPLGLIAALLTLVSCYEPASTYDPKRGRYVDTQEYRRDQIIREIDKRELENERKDRR